MQQNVLFSCIALGLTQMISLDSSLSEGISNRRYLRTKSKTKISEATVLEYLRKDLFRLLLMQPSSDITRIIRRVLAPDFDTRSLGSEEIGSIADSKSRKTMEKYCQGSTSGEN